MILFMKFKFKMILFILLCFIIKKLKSNCKNYKIIYDIPESNPTGTNPTMDIVVGPGGRYGTYTLGICHYIKNNFDITNKIIVGFSAGSFNSIFMCIKKHHDNECLRKIFKINSKKISTILKETKTIIEKYNLTEYNIKNIYIASTTENGLVIYNNFLTIQDVTRCCTASSFIP